MAVRSIICTECSRPTGRFTEDLSSVTLDQRICEECRILPLRPNRAIINPITNARAATNAGNFTVNLNNAPEEFENEEEFEGYPRCVACNNRERFLISRNVREIYTAFGSNDGIIEEHEHHDTVPVEFGETIVSCRECDSENISYEEIL